MEPSALRPPIAGATAELPRLVIRVWPARLVRAAGIASTVLGAGHVLGVTRTWLAQAGKYDRSFLALLFLGIFMISQGVVLAFAARGVRESLSWARWAIIAVCGQGLVVMIVLMPLFILAGPNLFWAGPIGFGLVHTALLLRFATSR